MATVRADAMARPYSDDLRRKLLEAFDQGKASLRELAEDFGVSLGWAWKVSATRKRTGRMERPSYRPGAKRRMDEQALAGLLRSHSELENKTGHLWRVGKRRASGLKKSLHAQERDTEENRKRRQEFVKVIGRIDLDRLIFLDESGAPDGRWKILTILGAMSTRGMIAAMTVRGGHRRGDLPSLSG